jgi:predicted ribosome quality control (RQC) complex YloA/Tae2 family protein
MTSDYGALTRIPFDWVVLEAVAGEIRAFEGGLVQRIQQPEPLSLVLKLYKGGEGSLLISAHPEFCRSHFVTRRFGNAPEPSTLLATIRSRIENARLVSVQALPGERVLELGFEGDAGPHLLVAELMGKHSNLMLLDPERRIVAATKWVPPSKSSRPILSGQRYVPPPVLGSGGSRFWSRLCALGEPVPGPVYCPGYGAYPYSVAALGYSELARSSISVALEQHFDEWIARAAAEALRAGLLTELRRVRLAREVAIHDLTQALEAGGRAGALQQEAELILAYGGGLAEGASVLEAWDYAGSPVSIRLDPTLSFKENAERRFAKAKRAKGRMEFVREQLGRLTGELSDLDAALARVEMAETLADLEAARELARARRWLMSQPVSQRKEDRPYEGHRIREAIGPNGVVVLYGETAEANDYLTLRVARPNDYWLHVRGGTSAHVVIPTQNQPERIGREVLEFAAKVAVAHSASKHSSYVPVDYTLKKYVRKPRGAAKGSALYTHEKTLHVSA